MNDQKERSDVAGLEALNPARLEATNAAVAKLAMAYPSMVETDMREIRATLAGGASGNPIDMAGELRRFAHNFKGQGASFGNPLISAIAKSMHDYLHAHDQAAELRRDTVEGHLDAIDEVFDRRLTGDYGAEGAAILNRLATLPAL